MQMAAAVEQPWSALSEPFLTLLAQMASGTTPIPLYGGHFHSGGVITGRRALTIESLLMSWCG